MDTKVVKKTSFKGIVAAYVVGYGPAMASILIPMMLLLSIKMSQIAGDDFLLAFSLVSSLGMVFALFGNPIGGAISDKTNVSFGRRRTWILFGATITGAALLLIGFADMVAQVIVLWCIAQFFFNFMMAAYTALIPDQVDEEKRGSMSGIFGLMPTIFMMLGMFIISAASSAPTEAQWALVAAFAFVGPVISLFIIKEGKIEKVEKPKEEKTKLTFSETVGKIYPSPRKYPEFTLAIFLKFFVMAGLGALMLMSAMFIDMGLSEEEVTTATSMVMMLSMIGACITGPLGGFLSDKFKKQKIFLYISIAAIIFGLLIFAFSSNTTTILFGALIAGLGQGCFMSVDTALVSRILPNPEDAAKDFGLMNVANTLPGSLVPAIMAPMVALVGWTGFFVFLAVGMIIALVVLIRIPDVGEQTSRERLLLEETELEEAAI